MWKLIPNSEIKTLRSLGRNSRVMASLEECSLFQSSIKKSVNQLINSQLGASKKCAGQSMIWCNFWIMKSWQISKLHSKILNSIFESNFSKKSYCLMSRHVVGGKSSWTNEQETKKTNMTSFIFRYENYFSLRE